MPTQIINPLLFMPSPRDIQPVKALWETLPYDKFIVKYTPEYEAYDTAKRFFTQHTEYTHLVICPDDLEVTREAIFQLGADIQAYGYDTIAGICNIDETQPDVYAIQPIGCDYTRPKPDTTKNAWYISTELPLTGVFEVGHSGFACQFISRNLLEKIDWTGTGYFDWQFSKQCHEMEVPIMIDSRVSLWHRRNEQREMITNLKPNIGYTEFRRFFN